jgi:hypothetical protein
MLVSSTVKLIEFFADKIMGLPSSASPLRPYFESILTQLLEQYKKERNE